MSEKCADSRESPIVFRPRIPRKISSPRYCSEYKLSLSRTELLFILISHPREWDAHFRFSCVNLIKTSETSAFPFLKAEMQTFFHLQYYVSTWILFSWRKCREFILRERIKAISDLLKCKYLRRKFKQSSQRNLFHPKQQTSPHSSSCLCYMNNTRNA